MSRKASETTCRDCDADILVGQDHDVAAFTVRVEPHPLADHRAELACLVLNRRTYALDLGGRLYRRDPRAVLHAPAHDPIHPTHICHQPIPSVIQPALDLFLPDEPQF